MLSDLLEFHAPGPDIKFRVQLLAQDNPDVVAQVLNQLPLNSVLGHVVISGVAIWMPTKIVHRGKTNMVKRSPGAVYLYAPGQTICLTYGAITESALVNKFGQVLESDLPQLAKLGEYVWEQTVSEPRKISLTLRSGGSPKCLQSRNSKDTGARGSGRSTFDRTSVAFGAGRDPENPLGHHR